MMSHSVNEQEYEKYCTTRQKRSTHVFIKLAMITAICGLENVLLIYLKNNISQIVKFISDKLR